MFRGQRLVSLSQRALKSSSRAMSSKLQAPPMVYITGEEYSRYACELYMDSWIRPFIDTSKWEFYDLSCVSR